MAATVDPQSLTVGEGAQRWQFVLDAAGGSASLQGEDGPIRLRLLRWGEKCALARFAAVGGEFLAAQMLRTCADPPPTGRTDGAARALLLWLHAPDVPPLPMDTGVLARVTLDVRVALGCGLDDLARRPAPEIEALWHALDRPQTGSAQTAADDDVTRIMVLPDELQPASPQPVCIVESFVPPRPSPAVVEATAAPHPPAEQCGSDHLPATTPAEALPPAAIDQVAIPKRWVPPADPRPRYRVRVGVPSGPDPHLHEPVQPAATPSEGRRSAPQPVGTEQAVITMRNDGTAASTTARTTPLRGQATPAAAWSPPDPPAGPPLSGVPHAASPTAALARVLAAVADRPAVPHPTPFGDDAANDALAERLEEAADALGIALVD